jgi:F-type H+-transporting ATPase subunit gamma
MTATVDDLRQALRRTEELKTVITTMKLLAAIAAGRLEATLEANSTATLMIERGFAALLRTFETKPTPATTPAQADRENGERAVVVVFGSSQGLVGAFNRRLAEHAESFLKEFARQPRLIVWGERVADALRDLRIEPHSVVASFETSEAVSDAFEEILEADPTNSERDAAHSTHPLYLVYNAPSTTGGFQQKTERILPLDDSWLAGMLQTPWPSATHPEFTAGVTETLRPLIEHHLTLSLHRMLAQSRLSEQRARLLAMMRAEKRIEERLEDLRREYHSARQEAIDAELFDLISGFESLSAVHLGMDLRSDSMAESAGKSMGS